MTLQTILGNFALILFVLMVITGVIWCADRFVLAKQRRLAADAALQALDARNARLAAEGIKADNTNRAAVEAAILRQPTWVEYSGSFFPVIALVFFLRSFLYEPFKIPSGSMVPTLLIGDLILVNKYSYGIRLPVLNKKVIEVGDPQRGDVMVFKYPKDMSQDYIKRVIGVPGDKITYENKRLTVNGKAVEVRADGRLPGRRQPGLAPAVPRGIAERDAPDSHHENPAQFRPFAGRQFSEQGRLRLHRRVVYLYRA